MKQFAELRVLDDSGKEVSALIDPDAITSISSIGKYTWVDVGRTTFKLVGSSADVLDAISGVGCGPCKC